MLTEVPDAGLRDGMDVLVRLNAPVEKSLSSRRLASGRRVLCASPAYLDQAPVLATPEDLEQHRCLAYRVAFEPPRWRLRDGEASMELDVAPVLVSNSGEVLRRAACDGMGVTLLPEWLVEADLAAGRLQPCLAQHAAHPIGYDAEIFVVWRRGAFVPAKVEAFVDYLVGCLQERPWFSG
jgi:DNA-binding transcriptional LysR family regulator